MQRAFVAIVLAGVIAACGSDGGGSGVVVTRSGLPSKEETLKVCEADARVLGVEWHWTEDIQVLDEEASIRRGTAVMKTIGAKDRTHTLLCTEAASDS